MAQAVFSSDGAGKVDLASDAPVSGSYANASAMGLIWSQVEVEKATSVVSPLDTIAPLDTEIAVIVDGLE
ncbi:acyl-CoA thioesterase/BAAT N-terminal domain-containing protein, partial [Rhizobiaceae sp. 2RAB30]